MREKQQGKVATPIIIAGLVIIIGASIGGYLILNRGQVTSGTSNRSLEAGTIGALPTISQAQGPVTDQELNQDFKVIDAQLKALDADAGNIEAGLNDKMGDLSE